MARIVLTTFGSLGDLHPYLAVALELKRRGHQAVVATHDVYRGRAEAMGLEFADVRPRYEQFGDAAEVMRQAMDARRGSEVVLRRMVLPFLRESRDDLLAAARGADLLVDHVLTFGAPLVAETLRIPRASSTLQPFAMFSAHDPPATPAVPWLAALRGLGPAPWRLIWALGRVASRGWFREVDAMRGEMGLPARREHPMFHGASRDLHLALFSRELAPPQPDWPPGTVQPGFPIHDRGEAGEGLSPALAAFLDRGEAPLVFTLGSSAVYTADGFYAAAAGAARQLGRRAVLLTGLDGLNPVPGVPAVETAPADATVVTVAYAPHSEVMPRACAVVHQGGVGTTAQAMRSGRPMLVVPFSHDQPDNAARCARLGIARTLVRSRVSASSLARELSVMLPDQATAARARAVAERMRREPGAAGAADAIEALLARTARTPGGQKGRGQVSADMPKDA
jgi:UDP:flavonoid glycosyltransferase YjiC (YdhE family)